jgi:CDGSH-type Zn-finger protein
MEKENKKGKIVVSKDGPYLVSGSLPLQKEIIMPDEEGLSLDWKKREKYPQQESYELCRCGKSKNEPYCDGSHEKTGFKGKETASRKKYLEQVDSKTEGPDIELTDAESLCACARFCDRKGGTWDLTENSKHPDKKKLAIEQACNCPSGRLVMWDKKTKEAIEPQLEESIGIVEDFETGASGPLWVKGGVEIESADGEKYEKRNRVTLCRCGGSHNKPFCDGRHIGGCFNDGDDFGKYPTY